MSVNITSRMSTNHPAMKNNQTSRGSTLNNMGGVQNTTGSNFLNINKNKETKDSKDTNQDSKVHTTKTGFSKSQRVETKAKSKLGVMKANLLKESKGNSSNLNTTNSTTTNENDKNTGNIGINLNKEFFSKKEIHKNDKENNAPIYQGKNKFILEIISDTINDENMSDKKIGNQQNHNSLNPNDLNVTMISSKDDSAIKDVEGDKLFRESVLGGVIHMNTSDNSNNNFVHIICEEKVEQKIKNKNSNFLLENNQNNNNNIYVNKTKENRSTLSKTIKNIQINLNSNNLNNLSNNPSYTHNYENLLINKTLTPKFTNEEYRRMFTKLIRKDYSKAILNNLFLEEEIIQDPLLSHKITERMRCRMVDWMIEVFSNYKCDDHAFFISINLLDRFCKALENSNKILQPGDLHLIGVTAMFMASKYQDIYPLRLKIVYEKIAHKKLSMEDIKSKEEEISKNLDYNMSLPTTWDFINHFIEEIFYSRYNYYHIKDKNLLDSYIELDKEGIEKEKEMVNLYNKTYSVHMINLLKHVSIYLAKMNCHDYGLVSKKPSLIAASTIYVGMKICEQINKEEYVQEFFTKRLVEVSKKNENDIIKCAQKILYNAQNFDGVFTGLENLKRIHFNAIIELKVTK